MAGAVLSTVLATMISGVLPAGAAHAAPADKAKPAEAGSAEGRRVLDEAKAGGRRVAVVGDRPAG